MLPVSSEVLSAVLLKIQAFWDVTPCRPVKMYRRFEVSYCLHLQDLLVHQFPWTGWPWRLRHCYLSARQYLWPCRYGVTWQKASSSSSSISSDSVRMTNEMWIRMDMEVAAAFGWNGWRSPLRTAIRVAGFHVAVWTGYFPNSNQDGYPFTRTRAPVKKA